MMQIVFRETKYRDYVLFESDEPLIELAVAEFLKVFGYGSVPKELLNKSLSKYHIKIRKRYIRLDKVIK